MAALMADADLAIGSAGVSAYERAVMGLPSIILATAENQCGTRRLMVEAGAAADAGVVDAEFSTRLAKLVADLIHDGTRRMHMAQAAASLVDGRGPMRVFVASTGKIVTRAGANVQLRLAETADEQCIFELQNEPETRRFARNPKAPSADEHHHWLTRVLTSNDTILTVIEADGMAAGTVRLDRQEDYASAPRYEVSIAISPVLHGRGVGSAALALLRRLQPRAVLDALVLPDNASSIRLFARAGYAAVKDNLYRSLPAKS
jgi:RimJ/RimL family protein N-acetyltransferase